MDNKWRRIYAGCYEMFSTSRIDGVTIAVRAVVRYIPEWPVGMRWASEVWRQTGDTDWPEESLLHADDGPEATMKDAKLSVASALRSGWRRISGLGPCLDTTSGDL